MVIQITVIKNLKLLNLPKKKLFNQLVQRSDLFISHAGAGSVIDSINNQKIPILLPREKKYNEHIDNHQIEFYKKLLKIKFASSFKQIYKLKNKEIKITGPKKKIIF